MSNKSKRSSRPKNSRYELYTTPHEIPMSGFVYKKDTPTKLYFIKKKAFRSNIEIPFDLVKPKQLELYSTAEYKNMTEPVNLNFLANFTNLINSLNSFLADTNTKANTADIIRELLNLDEHYKKQDLEEMLLGIKPFLYIPDSDRDIFINIKQNLFNVLKQLFSYLKSNSQQNNKGRTNKNGRSNGRNTMKYNRSINSRGAAAAAATRSNNNLNRVQKTINIEQIMNDIIDYLINHYAFAQNLFRSNPVNVSDATKFYSEIKTGKTFNEIESANTFDKTNDSAVISHSKTLFQLLKTILMDNHQPFPIEPESEGKPTIWNNLLKGYSVKRSKSTNSTNSTNEAAIKFYQEATKTTPDYIKKIIYFLKLMVGKFKLWAHNPVLSPSALIASMSYQMFFNIYGSGIIADKETKDIALGILSDLIEHADEIYRKIHTKIFFDLEFSYFLSSLEPDMTSKKEDYKEEYNLIRIIINLYCKIIFDSNYSIDATFKEIECILKKQGTLTLEGSQFSKNVSKLLEDRDIRIIRNSLAQNKKLESLLCILVILTYNNPTRSHVDKYIPNYELSRFIQDKLDKNIKQILKNIITFTNADDTLKDTIIKEISDISDIDHKHKEIFSSRYLDAFDSDEKRTRYYKMLLYNDCHARSRY